MVGRSLPLSSLSPSMELEFVDGTRIPIHSGTNTEIGRRLGFSTSDRTVSRRHVSFQVLALAENNLQETTDPAAEVRVLFEVVGANPILVLRRSGGEKRVFKKSEKGELGVGDRISFSFKNPSFFSLKNREEGGVEKSVLDAVQRREERTRLRREEEEGDERGAARVSGDRGEHEGAAAGLNFGFQPLDISQIDPIKEFGFIVRGHEFDQYPRQKIQSIKDWNWFLDEQRENSEDEENPNEVTLKQRKGQGRRKKRGEDSDDEDWMCESEDEKVLLSKMASTKRPKYTTRSKDQKIEKRNSFSGDKPMQKNNRSVCTYDVTDEEDETLGGFIVHDNEEVEEEKEEEEEANDSDDEDE